MYIYSDNIIWNDKTKIELLHQIIEMRNNEPQLDTIEWTVNEILDLNLTNPLIEGNSLILKDVSFQFRQSYWGEITDDVMKYLAKYIATGEVSLDYSEDFFENDEFTHIFVFTNGKIIKKKNSYENGFVDEIIGEL